MLDINARALERIEWKNTRGEGRVKVSGIGIHFFLFLFCDRTIVVFMIFIVVKDP
jgi:hypothetical protein